MCVWEEKPDWRVPWVKQCPPKIHILSETSEVVLLGNWMLAGIVRSMKMTSSWSKMGP